MERRWEGTESRTPPSQCYRISRRPFIFCAGQLIFNLEPSSSPPKQIKKEATHPSEHVVKI